MVVFFGFGICFRLVEISLEMIVPVEGYIASLAASAGNSKKGGDLIIMVIFSGSSKAVFVPNKGGILLLGGLNSLDLE